MSALFRVLFVVGIGAIAVAAVIGCSSPDSSGGSSGGGSGSGMMGDGASGSQGGGGCGSCHGADGRGGTITMMTGASIEAPDVTYDALIAAGFTDATIRAAIRDGVDEAGRPLDEAMPRWQMGAADLGATIAYLKTLSAP